MSRFFWMVICVVVLIPGHAQAGWLDDLGGALDSITGSKGGGSSSLNSLTDSDIAAGLKDALRVSSERVVQQLARENGFNTDPKIHIPLPASLKKVDSMLNGIGMGYLMDDLELKLNRAAEQATPKAKKLFVDAIKQMSFADVRRIYEGPDDAATQYFKGRMSNPLARAMRPIIEKTLMQVGAVQAYDKVMGRYQSLPFVPDVKSNLTTHVVDGGLSGIFHYIAVEEAAIRKDPVKRTTDILKKVFGN
jgi:hypothetical protein